MFFSNFYRAFLKHFMPIETYRFVDWFFDESFYCKKIIDSFGNVLQFSNGEMSGGPLTILINSLHALFLAVLAMIVCDFVTPEEEECDHEALACLGDDTNDQTGEKHTKIYRKVCLSFGHGIVHERDIFTNVSFLSHNYITSEFPYCILPYYSNIDKLYASLQVYSTDFSCYLSKLSSFIRDLCFAPIGSEAHKALQLCLEIANYLMLNQLDSVKSALSTFKDVKTCVLERFDVRCTSSYDKTSYLKLMAMGASESTLFFFRHAEPELIERYIGCTTVDGGLNSVLIQENQMSSETVTVQINGNARKSNKRSRKAPNKQRNKNNSGQQSRNQRNFTNNSGTRRNGRKLKPQGKSGSNNRNAPNRGVIQQGGLNKLTPDQLKKEMRGVKALMSCAETEDTSDIIQPRLITTPVQAHTLQVVTQKAASVTGGYFFSPVFNQCYGELQQPPVSNSMIGIDFLWSEPVHNNGLNGNDTYMLNGVLQLTNDQLIVAGAIEGNIGSIFSLTPPDLITGADLYYDGPFNAVAGTVTASLDIVCIPPSGGTFMTAKIISWTSGVRNADISATAFALSGTQSIHAGLTFTIPTTVVWDCFAFAVTTVAGIVLRFLRFSTLPYVGINTIIDSSSSWNFKSVPELFASESIAGALNDQNNNAAKISFTGYTACLKSRMDITKRAGSIAAYQFKAGDFLKHASSDFETLWSFITSRQNRNFNDGLNGGVHWSLLLDELNQYQWFNTNSVGPNDFPFCIILYRTTLDPSETYQMDITTRVHYEFITDDTSTSQIVGPMVDPNIYQAYASEGAVFNPFSHNPSHLQKFGKFAKSVVTNPQFQHFAGQALLMGAKTLSHVLSSGML